MRVAVIDVGKPGRNLGWAIDEPDEQGTDLDACIETLIVSLDKDRLRSASKHLNSFPYDMIR